jgi:hypothetical protein
MVIAEKIGDAGSLCFPLFTPQYLSLVFLLPVQRIAQRLDLAVQGIKLSARSGFR